MLGKDDFLNQFQNLMEQIFFQQVVQAYLLDQLVVGEGDAVSVDLQWNVMKSNGAKLVGMLSVSKPPCGNYAEAPMPSGTNKAPCKQVLMRTLAYPRL